MEEERVFSEEEKILTEIKTVDTLLDGGVRVTLPAPVIFRLFRKKTIDMVIQRPVCEVLYRISSLYMQMSLMAEKLEVDAIGDAHRLVTECMRPASRIIAYALRSSYLTGSIPNRIIARYLRKRLDTRELAELWTIVVGLSGIQDFSNTIRSMSTMRMTMPRTKT